MNLYYEEKLAAERLKRCYDLAPPRVHQYLEAELDFVLRHVSPGDRVLDLGCGYGRVIPRLAERVGPRGFVVGVDISPASLEMGKRLLAGVTNCSLEEMNAGRMTFPDNSFDLVLCIQNGISAFRLDARRLVEESLRVTRPGGRALFSTYAEEFWPHRLEWFRLQAAAGLLGEIDEEKTGNGEIVCQDGFRATTLTAGQFQSLTESLAVPARITVVDGSSLFCVMTKN